MPKTLPHNRLIRDGTHTPRCRPSNKGVRDTMWSGKKKMYSHNTVVEASEIGITVRLSGCRPGSWHDMHVQRLEEEEEDGGILTRCLLGKSGVMLVLEYGDRGFQGLKELHPGAVVRIPPKRKKGKALTKTEQAEAGRINRVRIVIEHLNARYKTFAAMRNKLKIGSEKLRRTFNVLSGFINYHLAMGMADPANTHRKGKSRARRRAGTAPADARQPGRAAGLPAAAANCFSQRGCRPFRRKTCLFRDQCGQNSPPTPSFRNWTRESEPRPAHGVKRFSDYE